MSAAVTGESRKMSDFEKPATLIEVAKWFFVRPSGYWTPAWGLFVVSWCLMTQLPFTMFWGNSKIGDKPISEVDPHLYWTVFLLFEFGWLVVSNVIFATFLQAVKLSSRIDKLEQLLQFVVRRDEPAAATGPPS